MDVARDAVAGAATDSVTVWMFDATRGDFDGVAARRVDRDIYRLLDEPSGGGLQPGDLVRCEVSEGELIVRKRIFFSREP